MSIISTLYLIHWVEIVLKHDDAKKKLLKRDFIFERKYIIFRSDGRTAAEHTVMEINCTQNASGHTKIIKRKCYRSVPLHKFNRFAYL